MKNLTPEYSLLSKQLSALLEGETNFITNLSQFSALMFSGLSQVNWAGFYLLTDEGQLQLGPFQGEVACTKIQMGKGVCGTVAQTCQSQLVKDVNQFEGYIACHSISKSELVCPLIFDDKLIGVFDLDSPELQRFNQQDLEGIEALVDILVAGTQLSR